MDAKCRFACLLGLLWATSVAAAEPPRTLPEGVLPDDVRLQPLKDLDGYFPFSPPQSKSDWTERAEQVRRQVRVALGLWPMPTKTPLNPVIHGKIERPDYTVEKVYFESAPGFFVTGNLYRPINPRGKVPGVLFAHGHWEHARFAEATDDELRREIATGAERFEHGGRSRFQSMCVQLARMGCVVWQWDMLGDSDSVQLSRELIHHFAKQRPEMNTTEKWGLFSPQAEAHLQSAMGLQSWNSIRSLDFLLSLPEVDPARIAVTGASGGGTQSMILAAIDPRVALSFPAVMVSTAMQGGCTCENACLLRVGTGNVEFAALFAPKPQGLTSADDWTKELATKGFPELQRLYELVGEPHNVMLHRGEHFPHNYNAVSRSAFYTWLNRHFELGFDEAVIERDYEPLSREQLTVWDDQHPAPKAGDPEFERSLLQWFTDDADRQIQAVAESPDEWRELVGGAVDVLLGRTWRTAGDVEWKLASEQDRGDYLERIGLVNNATYHEQLPVVWLHPKQAGGRTVIWLDGNGKSSLFAEDGMLSSIASQLVEAGADVISADLLYQGEFLREDQPLAQTPVVSNPREFAGFTLGYNRARFAQRAHDVLTLVQFVRSNNAGGPQATSVAVGGMGGAGPIVAAARAVSGDAIDRAAVHTGKFRFGELLDYRDPQFLPGAAKYLDLPGFLALGAPQRLLLAGEGGGPPLVLNAYRAANQSSRLTVFDGGETEFAAAAANWCLED